jgi:N utilization substance protein B
MGIRHLGRQRALQLLYALEFAAPGAIFLEVERLFLMADVSRRRGWGPFARRLAETAYTRREDLDEAILPLLRKWTLDRLPWIDRLCLRMALCELRYFPDIPLRVTLNEYIDLARLYSTDESPQYVNAMLDQLSRDFQHKDFQANEPDSESEEEAGTGAGDAKSPKREPKREPKAEPKNGPEKKVSPAPPQRKIQPSLDLFKKRPE